MHKKIKGDIAFWIEAVLGCLYIGNGGYRLAHPYISHGKKKDSKPIRVEKNHFLRSNYYC